MWKHALFTLTYEIAAHFHYVQRLAGHRASRPSTWADPTAPTCPDRLTPLTRHLDPSRRSTTRRGSIDKKSAMSAVWFLVSICCVKLKRKKSFDWKFHLLECYKIIPVCRDYWQVLHANSSSAETFVWKLFLESNVNVGNTDLKVLDDWHEDTIERTCCTWQQKNKELGIEVNLFWYSVY